MTTTPNSEGHSPNDPPVNVPTPDPIKKESEAPQAVSARLPEWVKPFLVIVPLLALLTSVCSLAVSITSCRYALGYTRVHEDHDVVARVLGVKALTKGFSSIETNGEVSVDVALINKGNQKEIIREAFLCYSDTNDVQLSHSTWRGGNPELNLQLAGGAKHVLHLLSPFGEINTGRRMWMGVAVRAIAPNAEDIEVLWPVCEINLATNGNGAWFSYSKDQTPQIQIISNKRQPHQRSVADGL